MNGQDSWKRTQDIEIDLTDLLKCLGRQWKRILICALASALLAGGYGYMKNKSSTKVQNTDAVQDIELTPDEEQSVQAAVQLYEETAGLEQYLENSLLMQADPYHRHKTYLLYSVEQAQRQDVQKITESYLSFVINGGAADALQKTGGEWDVDKSCLAEIMTAYQKVYSYPYQLSVNNAAEPDMPAEAVFYVELTGLDEEMAGRLSKDLQKVLKDYSAKVRQQAGNHKLKLVQAEHAVAADTGLQAQQHDKRAQLAANEANLKSMTDAFSENQMAVYEKEREEAEVQKAEAADRKPADESIKDGRLEAENVSEDEAGTGNSLSAVLKYIVLGFAGGIFLYGGFYVCWYLFQDTVKSTREMQELYTFPFYGGVHLGNKAGRKQIHAADTDGQKAKQLVSRIRLACRKQGITKLCLASDFLMDTKEKDYIGQMAEQLSSFGIEAVTAENASTDTAQWDMLAETGTVLLVCRLGMTTHRMIDDAMRFYQENGVAVIGAMTFGCNG